MSQGKTRSPYALGARRRRAYELYSRGFTPSEVKDDLQVSLGTAVRYKTEYEESVAEEARANPTMLRNVIANTMRALRELDLVRAEAWKNYETAKTEQMKNQFLNTIVKAQDQRAKLFGLFGVKQDFFMHVAQVREQQQKLIAFMTEHLCPADRVKLEEYLVQEFNSELAEMPTAEGIPNN